ncbi:MAG: hypothetical protein AAGA60_12485 [Cyanobacteria bacterium P01_E01_bin.42]
MVTGAEIEQRWIDAWNELYELIKRDIGKEEWQVECFLPDGSIVDVESCQGWLQDSAYSGYLPKVEVGWIKGKRGIIASRMKERD